MDNLLRFAGFADEASDSIEGQCRVLKALGWSHIELRGVNGKQICDLSEEEFQHVLETLKKEGIQVCSLGSNIANWGQSILAPMDETIALVERTVPRAKALGAKYMRIMSYSILTEEGGIVLEDQKEEERFRRLRYITDTLLEAGITPVHENCFTYGGLSYEHTLKLLENVPGLKLVFDTGNPPIDVDVRTGFPYSYQSAWEFYEAVKPYIAHVHIKDSWCDEKGGEHYTFPGEGKGDVVRIVEDLERSGYTGFYSMEPHMAVVFHDKSKVSSEEARMANFQEYGKRFMELYENSKNV
ncbi:MAG: sugar phosphate isomerase/epimerase [Spirochaetales bacterium]|nr:sugar phosphate isomerase/epimerase [Candidatus Physcosoma equi]